MAHAEGLLDHPLLQVQLVAKLPWITHDSNFGEFPYTS
jgi:hypothetical protein